MIVLHRPHEINTSNSLACIAHVCYHLLQGQTLLSVALNPAGLRNAVEFEGNSHASGCVNSRADLGLVTRENALGVLEGAVINFSPNSL